MISIEKQNAILKNKPFVEIFEKETPGVYKVRIELDTFTPSLLFSPEALHNFYAKIEDYYQYKAKEFIPNKFHAYFFDRVKDEFGETIISQLNQGSVILEDEFGNSFFTLTDSIIEIDFVKENLLEKLTDDLIELADQYHSGILHPCMALVGLFESYTNGQISIRDFGIAFDLASPYALNIPDYKTHQRSVFEEMLTLPSEVLRDMKETYIDIHKKFGHELVEDTIEAGYDEFLLFKAKKLNI
jgi:hypothetical protein